MVMVFVVHIWAYFYQRCAFLFSHTLTLSLTARRQYTREMAEAHGYVKYDFRDAGYVGRVLLYIFCGLLDAMWQTTAYWVIGAMSNNPAKLAHFTGFCKPPRPCYAVA